MKAEAVFYFSIPATGGENVKLYFIRNRKFLVIIASIFVITSAISSYYLYFYPKSPRDFYLEAEARNFKKYSDHIKQIYGEFYENQKPYMNGKYRNRLELTADIRSDTDKPFGFSNSRNVFDIIRKSKLIIDNSINSDRKETGTRLSLSFERMPLLDAAAYTAQGHMRFNIPVLLSDKYFSVDLGKLDEVYDRFYQRYNIVAVKPKRVIRAVDLARSISFSGTELDRVERDYGAAISALIDRNDVTYGKEVKVKIGGEQKEGKEIIVSLNGDKTRTLLQTIAEKAGLDDALLKLSYGNYTDVIEILDQAGLFQLFDVLEKKGYLSLNDALKFYLNGMNIKKDLNGFKEAMKEFGNNTAYPEGLEMKLVVDKSGNILGRNLKVMLAEKASADKVVIGIDTHSNSLKDDNFRNGFASFSFTTVNPAGTSLTHVWDINTNFGVPQGGTDKKGSVDINYFKRKNDNEEYTIQLKLDTDKRMDDKTMKENSSTRYSIGFREGINNPMDVIKGELSATSWKNDKQKTRNMNATFTLNADLPSLNLKNTELKFNLVKEDKFDAEFKLPDVKQGDLIDLNRISDRELDNLEISIARSFGAFYLKNRYVVDTLFGQGG